MSGHGDEAWDDLLFGRGTEEDDSDGRPHYRPENYYRDSRGRYHLHCRYCKNRDVRWHGGMLVSVFTNERHRCGADYIKTGFEDET